MPRLLCFFLFLLIGLDVPCSLAAERIVGVTVDSIQNVAETVQALSALPQPITTRIVFDEFVQPKNYVVATRQIHDVASVMGELLDSSAFAKYSREAYVARTRAYLRALDQDVDIWEIGNELNGEWLGDSVDVADKAAAAFDVVRTESLGGKKPSLRKTALTLVFNEGCADRADHEVIPWAQAYVADRIKQHVDYVFLSFYEDDCPIQKPDWTDVFERLGKVFPHAHLGFGEVGTKDPSRKIDIIQSYYKLQVPHPRYVGGFFWWYFREDMVPASKPLWKILKDAI